MKFGSNVEIDAKTQRQTLKCISLKRPPLVYICLDICCANVSPGLAVIPAQIGL